MIKKNPTLLFIAIILLASLSIFIHGIGFSGPSPTTGQADYGNQTGNFTVEANTFTATQLPDAIYYAMRRGTGLNVTANQTLGFNISFVSSNKSKIIRLINGSITYCHARTTTTGCGGGANPQGTTRPMRITILNVSSGRYDQFRSLPSSVTNTLQTVNFSLNFTQNFSNYINASQFITIMFDFNWSGAGATSFLNDLVNITIFYDTDNAFPNVSLITPPTGQKFTNSSINFTCASTDDFNLSTVTLFTNISGAFVANQTLGSGGKANTSIFEVKSIGNGSFMWNCQAKDVADKTNFSAANFTFVVDTIPPAVTNLTPFNLQFFQPTSTVNITANVTDTLAGVDTVLANVTLPNASTSIIKMTGVGTIYSASFNATLLQGIYNITFIANDTLNNINNSVTTSFNITDTSFPSLVVRGCTPNPQQPFLSVVCNATITATSGINVVNANVTQPNGTVIVQTPSVSGNNYSFTFTRTNLNGTYAVEWYANNTNNKINNTNDSFRIVDTTPPNILLNLPANNSVLNTTQVNFSFTATDNLYSTMNCSLLINNIINATNATTLNNTLTAFNVSSFAQGANTWAINCSDPAGNTNLSPQQTFTVDTIVPAVINLTPFVSQHFNQSQIITITANVTDSLAVDKVLMNITSPDLTSVQTIMTRSGDIFNATFTNTLVIGLYNITYVANDTANNVNRSVTTSFNISDVTPPAVTTITPNSSSINFFYRSNVTIKINATDPFINNTDKVFANITQPNGTVVAVPLFNTPDGFYNATFNQTDALGTFLLKIYANDTSGNINSSVTQTFFIVNNSAPTVTLVSPANNAYNNTGNITFSCSASSTNPLSNITLFTNSSGTFTPTNLTIVSGTFSQVNITILNINESKVSWNCDANDTLGLAGFAGSNFTIIVDKTKPAVTGIQPVAGNNVTASSVLTINATVTDNELVNAVYASVVLPNSTIINVTMPLLSGSLYQGTFTNTNTIGRYNVTFIANDLATNVNNSVITFFNVIDILPPSITVLGCRPNPQQPFMSVICNATITDTSGISVVNANVTQPNTGTVIAQTITQTGSVFKFNFTSTTQNGTYVVQWYANDTSNNINTSNDSFNVVDTIQPSISLNLPLNNAKINTQNVSFNFTAVDNFYSTMNCSLLINNTINQTNATTINNTLTNFVLTNLLQVNNTWQINCTDPAGNSNVSRILNFSVDFTPPAVINILPTAGSTYLPSTVVNISANVTDNVAVDTVFVNITLPNSSTVQSQMVNAGDIFNSSFTNTILAGRYNISYIANDSTNNINNSVTTYFTIVDTTFPNITVLGCSPSTPEPFQSVVCNATITSASGLNIINANVTQPTTGTVFAQSVSQSGNNYSFTFSPTTKNGTYAVRWYANNTNGNAQTANDSFAVIDTIPPSILLLAPINAFQTNNNNITFSFNATDNFDSTLSCSLWVNSTLNQTNPTVQNNTFTSLIANSFPDGGYDWNISCTDQRGNFNSSPQRTLLVDTGPPEFNSLTYVPNQAFQLKPNVQINFTGNVTDNLTGVASVILQEKLSTAADYTNITMNLISGELYNGSFTPTVEGTYNVRLHSTDGVGNSGNSAITNITIAFQRTWDVTPIKLTTKNANASQNITLGNFTLNNTGDFPLNFTITSDYANTRYDTTFPVEIAANQKRNIEVNITTPATDGTTTVRFTVDATPNANPNSTNATGTVVIAPGQPILDATLSAPATATRGTTILLSGSLQNVGDGNATNVSMFYILPSGWSVVIGTQNISVGDLFPGDTANNNVQVAISGSASTGSQTVILNSSGNNASGADLAALNLIVGDSKVVQITAPTPLGPGGGRGGGGGGGGGAASASSGGGGFTVTPRPPTLTRTLTSEEFIQTKETVNLVRGQRDTFPLKITNVFADSILYNVKMEISGYLSQYLASSPEVLNDIRFAEKKAFTINVASPAYREKGTYEMVFLIKGDAIAKDTVQEKGKTVIVNSIKHFTEKRTVTLNIHEVSPELATKEKTEAVKFVEEIVAAKMPSKKASELLTQIDTAHDNKDFGAVDRLSGELQTLHDRAIEARSLIDKINGRIDAAKKSGVDASETKRLLVLAKSALDREDFEVALQRLREAEILALIEAKAGFNPAVFLRRFWWVIVGAGAALAGMGVLSYRKSLLAILAQKIRDLGSEEISIMGLMRDAQVACFKDKKISITAYHKNMAAYEDRLEKIKVQVSRLRTQRVLLSTLDEELKQLKKENAVVTQLMKESQEQYFIKHTLNRVKYLQRLEEYRLRQAEIEESTAVIEAKIVKREEQKRKIKALFKKTVNPATIKKIIDTAKKIKEEKEKEYYSKDNEEAVKLIDAESKQAAHASAHTAKAEESKKATKSETVPVAFKQNFTEKITAQVQTAKVNASKNKLAYGKQQMLSALKTAHAKIKNDFFSAEQTQTMTEPGLPQEKFIKITPAKLNSKINRKELIQSLKEAFE